MTTTIMGTNNNTASKYNNELDNLIIDLNLVITYLVYVESYHKLEETSLWLVVNLASNTPIDYASILMLNKISVFNFSGGVSPGSFRYVS